MVKVIGIIGARLNSSRLPAKHLLDLAGRPMIDHIFDRLSRVPEIDKLVLATTHDDFNQPLIQWAHDHQREVFAYEGDVNDLIGRMDAIVHKEDPEIVCYFCGDNPLLDPAMLSRLIQQLQATPAADYVEFIPSPGPYRFIHESFNIYRRTVWDRMVASSTSPFEREHVGQGLRHFKDQLRMTYADEEPLFCSVEHRLSEDTPSDYTFMTSIYERWYAENPANTIVSLRWVIEQLLKDPVLRVINEDVRQKDAQERSHKVAVITQCGKDVGLGHLSRAMVAARACQDHLSAGVIVGIYGEEVAANQLALIPHRWLNDNEALEFTGVDTLLIDLHPQHHPVVVRQMIRQAHEAGVSVVVIDGIYDMPDQVDVFFIPSFMLPANIAAIEHPTVHYGWDHFLLQPAER